VFFAYKSKARNFVLGKELFSVYVSTRARVLEDKGDRLQVEILEGPWKGRVGWIASDEVRLPPTPEEASRDVIEGLTLDKRREIYAELHRVGMLAEFEAEHQAERQFPMSLSDLPSDPSQAKKVMERHTARFQALSHSLEKKGREPLVAKYKIDGAHLDRIDNEGTEKRWPLPEVADPYRH
jgi:hypothetical protein